MSKTVLIIGAVWPESNSSAAGQNMFSLLSLLRRWGFSVIFTTAAAPSAHADNTQDIGVELQTIALNDSSFDKTVARIQPDIVVFDRYMSEEQFSSRVRKICPNALHILNTEDLHSLRNARHEAIKRGENIAQAKLNTALAQREVAAILRCDVSLIISKVELDLLINTYSVPASQLHYFPLQQPLPKTDNAPTFSQRQHFITVGNFKHAPNWDAVLHLKQEIWPVIRKKLPESQLHIYGAYPPKKATQLHSPSTGFLIKGWIEDIETVMASARVCVAPLRFGAGIKGKLLTAMCFATPSVTTHVGAEGIAESQAWPGAVSEDIEQFSAYAIDLYKNAERWQQASHQSQVLVNQYREQQHISQQALLETIMYNLEHLPDVRQAHFLQSMLWHHSLRASQFMTQWIEAKNKV